MTAKRFEVVLNEFDEVEYIMDKEMMEDRDFAEFIDFVEDVCKENEQLKKQRYDLYGDVARLVEENEQLKEQLSEAKADEKQLGISFMGYKMKLIEVLQKRYDKVKGKTLYADVYTEIAEEMGVDLE